MENSAYLALPLFAGLAAGDIPAALAALDALCRPFAKGETLLEAGQRGAPMGVVLAGRVLIEHLDLWGNRTLLGRAARGRAFCRDLRLSARPADAGQRGGGGAGRGTVFGPRQADGPRVRTLALADDAKPFAHFGGQKFESGPPQPVHCTQDHPGAGDGLLFHAWPCRRAAWSLSCPLTASSCRPPGRRPQCAVQHAFRHAARRPADHRPPPRLPEKGGRAVRDMYHFLLPDRVRNET